MTALNEQTAQLDDWQLVVEFLHHNGKHRDLLNDRLQGHIRLLADGFGDLRGARFAPELLWDWSHVRDSSPAAVKRMADKIRDLYPVQVL